MKMESIGQFVDRLYPIKDLSEEFGPQDLKIYRTVINAFQKFEEAPSQNNILIAYQSKGKLHVKSIPLKEYTSKVDEGEIDPSFIVGVVSISLENMKKIFTTGSSSEKEGIYKKECELIKQLYKILSSYKESLIATTGKAGLEKTIAGLKETYSALDLLYKDLTRSMQQHEQVLNNIKNLEFENIQTLEKAIKELPPDKQREKLHEINVNIANDEEVMKNMKKPFINLQKHHEQLLELKNFVEQLITPKSSASRPLEPPSAATPTTPSSPESGSESELQSPFGQ